jgi:membrane protein
MQVLKAIIALLRETIEGWGKANGNLLAAAMAYYTTFSLAPLLVIAISIAGLFFGVNAVTNAVVQELSSIVNPEVAAAVEQAIQNTRFTQLNSLAALVSLVALVIGASILFVQLKRSINMLWGITLQPGAGIWVTLKTHFLSFVMVLFMGVLLIMAMAIGATVIFIQQNFQYLPPNLNRYMTHFNFGLLFVFFTFFFAIIFKTLPEAKVAWKDVWFGSMFTSMLLTLGEFLIGIYLGRINLGGALGAASSTILILIWIYLTMQIILIGAKFTQVYANNYGTKIQPNDKAELIIWGENNKEENKEII